LANLSKDQYPFLLEARHPVAIFSMGIGDHLLALPAMRALTNLFDERLSLICQPGAREVFFRDLSLKQVHEIKVQHSFDSVRSEKGKPLRRVRFNANSLVEQVNNRDLLISLNYWHSPSVDELLEKLSPVTTMGFFSQFKFQFSFYGKHASDVAFSVPQSLDSALRIENFAGPPSVLPAIQEWARTWRTRISGPTKVLGVHAETKPSKMWPVDRFVETLDEFLGRHRDVIVLALGISDLGLDKGKHGERVVPCDKLPLPCVIALMGQADFFLGIDSCLLHVADLFCIPGVGLFGPTKESDYGFRFAPHRHLRGFDGTMDAITPSQVLNALESVFSENVESKAHLQAQ
jgi:ADP-heptose:LPS heptosyltransferase